MFVRQSKWLVIVASLAVAVLVGACGAPATTAPATSAPATTAAQATTAPTTGAPPAAASPTAAPVAKKAGDCGTLRLLYWQAVTTVNPHLSQGTKDSDAATLVVEPLAYFGGDGKPVAALAAELPTKANGGFSADGTTVIWKLKPGVKWSDGSDFTADDVVFTWKYVSTKETAATTLGSWEAVKTVEAVDKNTVKVTFTDPQPDPSVAMVGTSFRILQKKQFEPFIGAKSKDGPNLATIGTGPYKIVEAKPNDVVTFTMNENYRGVPQGKPCFKDVIDKGGGDAPSSAKAVCQTGDADFGWNLQVEAAVLNPMVQAADAKCTLAIAPGGAVERLLLNRTNPDPALGDKRSEPVEAGGQPHPFLSDLKVRQALRMAIDTTTMATQLYGASGVGTCNIVTAPPALISKNTSCKPDVDGANKLLDDAGWVKGADGIRHKTVGGKDVRMHILYQTTVNALRQKEQAFVKDAWAKIGVETELKSTSGGVFFSGDEANPDTAAHFYADVEMFTNNPDSPVTWLNYMEGWICKEVSQKSNKWSTGNYERFCNKDYDALYNQALKETDQAKRDAIIVQMNDFVVNDLVIIPLVARADAEAINKSIKGYIPNPWDSELWNVADWTK